MSVIDNINQGVYANKKEYPAKRPKQSQFLAVRPTGTFYDDEAYQAAMSLYNEKITAYKSETYALEQQFKLDSLAELGLSEHPKADLFFKKAWEDGHAGGYFEVFSVMQDLAELLD